jgi:hypothetical protein
VCGGGVPDVSKNRCAFTSTVQAIDSVSFSTLFCSDIRYLF